VSGAYVFMWLFVSFHNICMLLLLIVFLYKDGSFKIKKMGFIDIVSATGYYRLIGPVD